MPHWIEEYPVIRLMHKTLPAADYNRVRVGSAHHPLPWRVELEGLRCLHCILDESAWVCVDACNQDLPILAWTRFNVRQRTALDAPVDCELRLFHIHAGLVMGRVLEELVRAVLKQDEAHAQAAHQVSSLNRT